MAASCIPYPSLRRHGIVGDRRTAALIAADGTVDWLCLPDYDGSALLGALLDARQGGLWRVDRSAWYRGEQRYVEDSAGLTTVWRLDEGDLELCDAMLWPDDERPPGQRDRRVLLRRTDGAVPWWRRTSPLPHASLILREPKKTRGPASPNPAVSL